MSVIYILSFFGNLIFQKILMEEEDEVERCMICLGPLETDGEHRVCSLQCGHIFGHKCILEWLNTKPTCPVCNNPSPIESVNQLYWRGGKVLRSSQLNTLMQENEKLKAENAEIMHSLSSNQTSQYSQGSFSLPYPTIMITKDLNEGFRLAFSKSRIIVTEKQNNTYGISYSDIFKPKWNFIPLHKLLIRDISINKSPIEKCLAVSHEGSFSIVNLTDNSISISSSLPEIPWCCCWINEEKVAIGAVHGLIFIINARTGEIISKKNVGQESPQFQSVVAASNYSVIALNCRNAYTFNTESNMFISNPPAFDHEYIKNNATADNFIAISLRNKKCTLCDVKYQQIHNIRWFPISDLKTRARASIITKNGKTFVAIPKSGFDFSVRNIIDIEKDLFGSFNDRYTIFEKYGNVADLDFFPGNEFILAAVSSSVLVVVSLPTQ